LALTDRSAGDDLGAEIARFTLGLEQLDGDVVEGSVRLIAGDVGEVAGGVADLFVGHYQTDFGFTLDGVDDVGGAEGDVEIGHIVLMEKSGFVGGDAHAENPDVGIFEDEMMMGFFGDGDGDGCLGVQTDCEDQHSGAEQQVQSEPPQKEIGKRANRIEERFLSAQADLPRERKGRKCVGLLRSK